VVACLSAHIAAAVDAADGRAWGRARGSAKAREYRMAAGGGQRAASWRERDQTGWNRFRVVATRARLEVQWFTSPRSRGNSASHRVHPSLISSRIGAPAESLWSLESGVWIPGPRRGGRYGVSVSRFDKRHKARQGWECWTLDEGENRSSSSTPELWKKESGEGRRMQSGILPNPRPIEPGPCPRFGQVGAACGATV